jgi:hypothetical protein
MMSRPWAIRTDCWPGPRSGLALRQTARLQQAIVPVTGTIGNSIYVGDQTRSACSGDSGGPLVVRDGPVWRLGGVASSGSHRTNASGQEECSSPSVYTAVSKYADWIAAGTHPSNIGGKVRDKNGQPMIGAAVKIFHNGFPVTTTITDANGNYGFHQIHSGQAMITAVGGGYYGSLNINIAGDQFIWPVPDIVLSNCAGFGSCGLLGVDAATFVRDITLPDNDPPHIPGESLTKTWRVRNSGTSPWNSYKLIFVSGDSMGAPSSVDIPYTPIGHEVDISIPVKVSFASSRGDWQITNPYGTSVPGGSLWVKVTVGTIPVPPPIGQDWNDIRFVSAEFPSVVIPGQQFRPRITVHVQSGQLLQSRGDLLRNTDNSLYGAWPHVAVVGTRNAGQDYTFEFYQNNPITAPSGEGTYTTKWRVWRDGNWAGPEIEIRFDVRNGGGTRPNPPTLQSPGDWYVSHDGSTPQLCVNAMAGVQYQFVIYESAQNADSGWSASNCWNPPTLGSNGYKWHARVKNSSNGLISDWSVDRHFNIESAVPSVTDIRFSPNPPSAAEEVWVYACANGEYEFFVNSATDGTTNGVWRLIDPPFQITCDPNSPPTNWRKWSTLQDADGNHVMRFVAHKNSQFAYTETNYTLQRRRPNGVKQIFPTKDAWLFSRTVAFSWEPALRAQYYTLVVSTDSGQQNKILTQTLDANTTVFTTTFSQDYTDLYWFVNAYNELGNAGEAGSHFGIDRINPVSAVTPLTGTNYDTAFQVSWSGSDSLSGLHWYDIQVRDATRPDNTTWITWLQTISTTTSLYNGLAGHTYCFRSRAMDTATNWEDYPASATGDTCTKIDPAAAPPTLWWNNAYAHKLNIIVLNKDSQTMPTGYPIRVHFDDSTAPTAAELYAASVSAVKGDDVRVIWNNILEAPRYIQTFSPTAIDIWLKYANTLAGSASDSLMYQVYYGNPAASNPPVEVNSIFPPQNDTFGNDLGLWHFLDGSGSSIADSSGNGHPGTASNMGWTSGKFGPAGTFNGTNSVVNVGNSTTFNTTNVTLEAWVYPLNIFTEHTIIRKSSNDGSLIYDFIIQQDGVYLRLNGSNGWVKSNTTLQSNRWYHIAGTYDGSSIKVYINGQLSNSVAYNVPLRTGTSTNLYLGGDGQFNNKYFNGYLQHVRVSNIARTSFPSAVYAIITAEPEVRPSAPIAPREPGNPDLAVQSFNTYPYPTGGTLVQAIVKNLGTKSTQSGFLTDLYLGHVPTGTGDYNGSVQFWVNDPIAAGATVTLTTVITNIAGMRYAATTLLGPIVETSGMLYGQVDSSGSVSETNKANNIYSTGTEVCVASVDAYEPDDSAATAIPLTVGQTQLHNVSGPGDQDWISFSAQGGITYAIQTANLSPAADTYLYLYGPDGTTLLASNDDYGGSLASRIDWAAPITGTYYVLVQHWNPNAGGCGTSYDLAITRPSAFKVYLPIVLKSYVYVTPPTPTPTGTSTKTPTPTATPTQTTTPTATPTSTPGPACSTWNLVSDWRLSPNQENPSRDTCGNLGVWRYMYSTSLTRDPQTYITLPVFVTSTWGIAGLEQWGINAVTVPDSIPPIVGFNSTDQTRSKGLNSWPPHTMRVHPTPNQLSVVGWRSPITASVVITGLASDNNPGCGDGILWYIDKGTTNLASGSFTDGGSQVFSAGTGAGNLTNVAVNQGDYLYFIVHPNTGHGCDSTRLEIGIHTVGAGRYRSR